MAGVALSPPQLLLRQFCCRVRNLPAPHLSRVRSSIYRARLHLPGRVVRVDLVGDAVAEERIANVALDDAIGTPAIGELAEVTLHLPPIRALAVPAAAVKRVGKADGVWRLAEGRARYTPVTTGIAASDGRVQILAGLTAGDEIIVHSSRSLAPAVRATVVDTLTKTAP